MSSSETGERADPAAFDLAGGSANGAAALCLHGLTGTPYEVRPLGEALAARGLRALGPALPGHNQTPEDLARSTQNQWVEAARAHLAALRADHTRVFAVGLSMGGLLSLMMAAEGRVDAVVVVGTPLSLPRPVRWLVPLAKHFHPFLVKREGSDVRDRAARARHPSYDVMPLHSVHELVRLQRRVRARLGRVRCPILVAHGALDRTANPRDAHEIRDRVGSEKRELLVLDASGHVVPVDYDGEALARATAEFLGQYL